MGPGIELMVCFTKSKDDGKQEPFQKSSDVSLEMEERVKLFVCLLKEFTLLSQSECRNYDWGAKKVN